MENRCENITDVGFGGLFENLQGLNLLESWRCNFSGCSQLEDEGIRSLSECISKLSSLKKVEFIATNCPFITEVCCEFLLGGIKKSESLESMILNLRRCQISDTEFNKLRKEAQKIASIKHFDVY